MNKTKKYILTARSSIPSCKAIRDAIETITGKKYNITTNPTKVTGKVIYRYGNLGRIPGEETNFNSPEFIHIANDKLRFSEFCSENNIYSPHYFRNDLPESYPVMIRKTLTGWGGRGIVICRSEQEFLENNGLSYYWTPFVKTQFEIRVHLFDNQVNRIYKKVLEEGTEEEFPIRNSHHYHFSLVETEKYPKVAELCKRLGDTFIEMGGHFSGVDLGYDKERKEYFVFEVNSAPGLNSVNAEEYARFFVDKLGLND